MPYFKRGLVVIALVVLVAAPACNKKSSAKSSAKSASTTAPTFGTITVPKASLDGCKLTVEEVAAIVGFAGAKTPNSGGTGCNYDATNDTRTAVVNIQVDNDNALTEDYIKAQDKFSLGGEPGSVTIADVTGFSGWAFSGSTKDRSVNDVTVLVSGGAHLKIRIYTAPNPSGVAQATALAHKLIGS